MAEAVEDEADEAYAQNIFILEKELGGSAATNEDSLLLKFFNQIEQLIIFKKKEEEAYNKSGKGSTTIG